MCDVEILGRPLYLPVKHKLKENQKHLDQLQSRESKKTLLDSEIEYARDEKDWWSCEDV